MERAATAEVVLVPTTGNGSLAAYSQALAGVMDVRCVPLDGCSGSFGHPALSRYSIERLARDARAARRLRRCGARLLHLTSQHLARFGPASRIPYVVTVHDLVRYRDCLERGRRPALIHRPNARDGAYLRLDAAGLRRAAALIAVSQHTRREVVEYLGVPADRVHVVYEAVDHSVFRPTKRRLFDRPYVLYVGSEQPRKNLETLFRAFAAVRAATGRADLALVKVGGPGGPEAPFREQTLEHARAAGLGDELLVTGRVSLDDLVAWYSGALCLVLPSRHEGFGLPPLEAMACGCPTIVSAAGALPEVVGEGGVVYGPPEDAAALAAVLRRLLESPRERTRLVEAGRRAGARFTWERTAAETLAVYRSVLEPAIPARSGAPRPNGAAGRRGSVSPSPASRSTVTAAWRHSSDAAATSDAGAKRPSYTASDRPGGGPREVGRHSAADVRAVHAARKPAPAVGGLGTVGGDLAAERSELRIGGARATARASRMP
jgi:glycosyltransferase involved in cell wall biosynthesis